MCVCTIFQDFEGFNKLYHISCVLLRDGLRHTCNLHKKPIVAQGSLCFGAPSDCFENRAQTMACSSHARDTVSQCAENASVAASQRADKSAAFCPSMRKRPSANSEMNLRRPASASGAVVQRAETRAGLDNTSTERVDKIMDEFGLDSESEGSVNNTTAADIDKWDSEAEGGRGFGPPAVAAAVRQFEPIDVLPSRGRVARDRRREDKVARVPRRDLERAVRVRDRARDGRDHVVGVVVADALLEGDGAEEDGGRVLVDDDVGDLGEDLGADGEGLAEPGDGGRVVDACRRL